MNRVWTCEHVVSPQCGKQCVPEYKYIHFHFHLHLISLRPIAFFFHCLRLSFFNLKNVIPWYYTHFIENCMQLYDFVVWHCATLRHLVNRLYRRSQLKTLPKPICYKFLIVECRVATLAQIWILKNDRQWTGKWQGLVFVRIIKKKKKKKTRMKDVRLFIQPLRSAIFELGFCFSIFFFCSSSRIGSGTARPDLIVLKRWKLWSIHNHHQV